MSRLIAGCGGLAAVMLVVGSATIASAAIDPHRKRAPRPSVLLPSIGSFTPAGADPRFGSSFGRAGLSGGSGFRFTPSVAPGGNRRVTVAVRARAGNDQNEHAALGGAGTVVNPYAYNLGMAVGWKRFALSGDYAKVDLGPLPGSRETADVAVSYAGRRWSTRLALGADRPLADVPQAFAPDRNVSVDLGGSYSINTRLDVTGGVRYRRDSDRLDILADDRRDSQAVYIGTAFRF